MAAFPTHPGEVTPRWLGDVLHARVDSVDWEPIGTGQIGDSARFHIGYAGGAAGPATLVAKFPAADSASRNTAAMLGLYRKEVGFYQHAAASLAARVPEVRYAAVEDGGADFILLFEDLGPARMGDQIAGCSLADAQRAIVQAAATHAPSWGRMDLLQADWIQPASGGSGVSALYPHAQAIFRERYADALAPELMAVCDAVAESGYIGCAPRPPQCLVHGDYRLDNLLFDIHDGAELIAVLDWQTVTAGRAMTDIGYFLGCGIGDALRRAHGDALLDLYLAEMMRRGVPLTRDAIWLDYRLGALHGIITAVFSAAFVERTPRGDANFLSMAAGACALALAIDSLGAIQENQPC